MKAKIFFLCVLAFALTACDSDRKHYLIGVSQCSEDSWRSKLEYELEQSTYFNEDVELIMYSADDNVEQQKKQIADLVSQNIDLLIVSPQQVEKLSDAIKKATDKNIPVILFDRKSDVTDYTAFMGADNYKIGRMLAEYAVNQLGGKGNIVEIAGEHGSSPAIERHRGFNDYLRDYPDIHIVGYEEGDWKQPSGEAAMTRILAHYNGPVDCVFGGNDRMAVGARVAIDNYRQLHPESALATQYRTTIYLGVDALPSPGGGIEKVRDGVLTASAIYPTRGDEVMQMALNILRGNHFDKITDMETSLVTSANANVLLLQHREIVKQDEYIKRMHKRVDSILMTLNTQRIFLFFIIFVVIIISMLLAFSIRAYMAKHRLNKALSQKNDELNHEKEIVERQRNELEQERDKLIEAQLACPVNIGNPEDQGDELLTGREDVFREENAFLLKFYAVVDKHLSNSDLSVEQIGDMMSLSRVQLYRKIKALTGISPVELVRQRRLDQARNFLRSGNFSIAEIAYKVGFSSPSYFTKCYKDYFGKNPNEENKQ